MAEIINHLIVEVSDSPTFATHTTEVVDPSTGSFPVSGVGGQTKYVRTKWQRTAANATLNLPADESGYSSTLTVVFPPCSGGCCGDAEKPLVPVIRACYGWSEFIEVALLASGFQGAAFEAYYAEPFAAGGGMKAGLFIKNNSANPDLEITHVDYILGGNYPGCAAFTSFLTEALDPAPLLSPRTTISANFGTSDTGDPGTPKVGTDYDVELLNPKGVEQIQYVLIPQYPGGPSVCPQDATVNTIAPGYWCQTMYSGARLTLHDFSANKRGGVAPQMMVQVYGRGLVVYITALGRTIFDPYMPAYPSSGWYGSFYGSLTPPARIKVRFSNGLTVEQDIPTAYGVGKAGVTWTAPTDDPAYALDDFFFFASETEFTNTLDQVSGKWQDALAGSLPAGVFPVGVMRGTNFLVSEVDGVALDPDKTYYFRVGARRFTTFKQDEPDYLYSDTLSDSQTGKLNVGTGELPPDATASPTGDAGGDLDATYPNPIVIKASTTFALPGDISPTSLSSSQNDYNPTGLFASSTLRLTSSTTVNITGIQGGFDGRVLTIYNVGANAITLKNNDSGSSSVNRFGFAGDIILAASDGITLQYDIVSHLWRAIGKTSAGTVTGAAGGDLAGTYPNPTVAQASAAFALTGDISPTSLSSNQSDYAPTGIGTAATIRLTASTPVSITGLDGGTGSSIGDGRIMTIYNIGSSTITLKNEDSGSTAFRRFAFSADVALAGGDGITLEYDSTTTRWRGIGKVTSGQTAAGSNTQVQFNDGGATGADADLAWDKTNNRLSIVGTVTGYGLVVKNATLPQAVFYGHMRGNNNDNNGEIRIGSNTSFQAIMEYDQAGDTRLNIENIYTAGTTKISLAINANRILEVTGNKRVAINYAGDGVSGKCTLHVEGASTVTAFGNATTEDQGIAIINNTNTSGRPYGIQFGGFSGYSHSGIFGIMQSSSGNTKGDIVFAVRNSTSDTALTEAVRITSDGLMGIGASPDSKAMLTLASTTRGFLPPRMTTTQRDAITSPPAGLFIYNTTTNKLNFYNGSGWEAVTSA